MNIKRIIKEEINNIREASLYFIMDESETTVLCDDYMTPFKNEDVIYLIKQCSYETYESANKLIVQINHYKDEASTNHDAYIAKHNPKIVPFDLILNKRDINTLDWD